MSKILPSFRKTAVLVFLLFPILAYALDGRVVSVIDGDTIYVLTKEKKRVKIRLSSIDSVEKSQPLGKKAKKALSNLIYGQYVHVEEQPKRDRWKRV
jgi:endonuclease YncB( thermonuclease family)